MQTQLNKDGVKYLLTPFRWTVLMTLAFFVSAGRLDIFRAWLAFGTHFMGAVAGGVLLWKFAPGLANQRGRIREGTKTWDKAILALFFILILLVIPVTAGLQIGRYRLAQLSGGYAVAGIICYLFFFVPFHWAMLSNAHFEGSSRIQQDRAHQVITTGPYRFVRHPGYVAMIFASVADALIIGSSCALIPGAMAVVVTLVRTYLEDKMLHSELEGYAEYAQQTKYRLIPGVW